MAVLDDFEKSQNTQGATKTDEGQTNSQADYIHPSSLLPPTDSEVILWKGHLTNFGLATFREFQIEAINAIEEGNDVVVIQRTGSGKSLVYQVPSLFSSVKYTIVICPTISLILNQVNHLKEKGVDAIPFGSPAGQEKEKHFARLDKMEERKPSLVYMTPECFATNMDFFTEHKNEIKMIVLDEAHKIFDGNSEFRKCYDCLKDIPATFVDIPVIALTATIDSQSLSKLCSVYLRHPVVIKGTVDRPNIKMSLGQYKLVTEQKKSKAKNTDGSSCKSNARPWKDVAQEICSMVGHNYAIVYVDFKNDVEKLVETLKECGVEDVKGYHGRDMSVASKVEIERAFNNKEIQILVATESFELGTHCPHVSVVLRIGCARKMRAVVQELGRAAREGNDGHFVLLVNESKDDQRFGYWTGGCSDKETRQLEEDFLSAWRFVCQIYTGHCLRKEFFNFNFNFIISIAQKSMHI